MSRRSPAVAAAPTQPVVPLRERFRREVASAIAAAAEEVFAEQGLHASHVGDIARRAGVAVGTLYNYYEDRDALLAALLRERTEELVASLEAALVATDGDATAAPSEAVERRLRAFVEAYFSFFVAHRPFFKILLEGELAQMQSTYPRSATIPTQYYQGILRRLEALFRRAVDAGGLRAERADLYPWLLLGMVRGVAVRDLRGMKAFEPADGAEIVHVLLHGAAI